MPIMQRGSCGLHGSWFRRFSFVLVLAIAIAASSRANAEELTLSRALQLARQRAPEMRSARAKVAAADAQVDVARAPYFPLLTATGTLSETAHADKALVLPPRLTPVSIVNYTTAGTAAASLRWTILDFGRTWNAVDAAKAAHQASEANERTAEASLTEAVAEAYLEVVYGEKLREIQRSIVEDRDRAIQVVKGLVKQALAAPVEELRAVARLEAALRDLEVLQAQLTRARIGL